MSKEPLASVILARDCLRYLSRDLVEPSAKALCNQLDAALRRGDRELFNQICSMLPTLVLKDRPVNAVREDCQVVSLIRFPIWPLNPMEIYLEQRRRVSSLSSMARNYSDERILQDAGLRVTDIFRSLPDQITHCKHGPGVVAETSDPHTKRLVTYVARSLRDHLETIPEFKVTWTQGCGRTLMVPKDHKTLRSISAEPTWTQWVQQGLMTQLMAQIEQHREFRGHIRFRDQELQRSFLKKEVATIDLSDASDTLRYRHLLLMKLPLDVRQKISSVRTPISDFHGIKYPTLGLFPMGAAVCFPLETLVFASLLLSYAFAETGHRPRNWGVFGDDIIVDTHLAGGFCAFLRRVGFSPNMRKTFIGGFFKETCGIHLYKGVDITPVKLKKSCPTSSTDERNISYRSYADQFRKRYLSGIGTFIDSLCDRVGSPSPTVVRWNTELQRLEYRALITKVPSKHGHWSYLPEALLHGKADVPCATITVARGWLPVVPQ